MQPQTDINPWWAALTVWGVVNAVNILQTAGERRQHSADSGVPFAGTHRKHGGQSRSRLRDDCPCDPVDYGTDRVRSSGRRLAALDRSRRLPHIHRADGRLVPYLVLFFGAILLMGLPMFRLNRQLWLLTVVTTMMLLGSMGVAMREGVA